MKRELQRLQDENETLRERIKQLEHELGADAVPVDLLGLTPLESQVLGVLMNAPGTCTRERIFQTIYGLKDNQPNFTIIQVLVHKVRHKVRDAGIDIVTQWGEGYSMSDKSKQALQAIIASHGDDMGYWDEEKDALASRMWREGASGGEIVEALGGNVTRNAVIGRMHRLHVAHGKPKDKKGAHLNGEGSAPKRKPKAEPSKPVVLPSGKEVSQTYATAIEKSKESRRAAAVPVSLPTATKAQINADAATRGAKVPVTLPKPKDDPISWPEFLPVDVDRLQREIEEDAGLVRFTARRDHQCAFPLWCDSPNPPLEEKMVCGAMIRPEQPNPYCAEHQAKMRLPKPVDRRPYVGMATGR